MKALNLSKKTVSNLVNLNKVKGGARTDYNCQYTEIGCVTHHPGCLEPTGVSLCLICMEEFTEGCDTTVTLC